MTEKRKDLPPIDSPTPHQSKETKNWNDLPWEMKEMVIKEMDITTRTRFKLCSKSDKYLAETTKLFLKNVEANMGCSFCDICFIIDDVKVELKEGMRELNIIRNGETRTITLENRQKADEWVYKYFESIVFNGKVHVENFKINRLMYPIISFKSEPQIKVTKLEVEYLDRYDCYKWFQHFAPCVKKLLLSYSQCFFRLYPFVGAAKSLRVLSCELELDDIPYFNATNIKITGAETERDFFRILMKKWIDEDYPIGSKIICDRSHSPYRFNPPSLEELFGDFETIKKTVGRIDDMFTMEYVIEMKPKKYLIFCEDAINFLGYITGKMP